MVDEFEQLLPFKWRDVELPVTHVKLSLAHDLVEHKYWGVDSGRVEATGVAVALHGGTGMSAEQFTDLIARGCAKVNISTALKIRYMQSGYDFMTANPGAYDPPKLFDVQRAAVKDMAEAHIRMFGSEGKAP